MAEEIDGEQTKSHEAMEGDGDGDGDDEDIEGIMESVRYLDELIQKEVESGVEVGRIVVGGFSMGCAVAMVWGLISKSQFRDRVAGVVGLSGFLPMAERLERMRNGEKSVDALKKGDDDDGRRKKKWFVGHGAKDMLVPMSQFETTNELLNELLDPGSLDIHPYQNMGHSTCASELRDLLTWLEMVIPA